MPFGAGGVDRNPGPAGGGGGGGGSFLDTMRSTSRTQSTLRTTQRSTAGRRRRLQHAGGRVLRKSASVPAKARNPIAGGHRDVRRENKAKRAAAVDRRLFGRGGFRGRQVDSSAFTSGFFDDGQTEKHASMESKLSSQAPF